jgi:hypothetical protein
VLREAEIMLTYHPGSRGLKSSQRVAAVNAWPIRVRADGAPAASALEPMRPAV